MSQADLERFVSDLKTDDALRAELAEARSQLAGAQEREDELQRDLNEALACLKAIQDEREMGGIEMGGMLSGFATDADTHQGSGCGSDGGAVPSLRHLASDKLGQQPLEEPSEDYNGLHSGAPHPNAPTATPRRAPPPFQHTTNRPGQSRSQ